ncbi:nuclease-related domain-containing protein [Lentibacillus persicus]|uniref:nuclease-related domain-containing protein n=1 Tax=Lentibacillus persicus TaxID=640948 RepID=UPI0015A67974|nr:nuclease-related domain-containing protein [Lentibacillus persicus]
MYVKPLTFPLHIHKALALDRRIAATHPQKPAISKAAANLLSGHRGEESLLYHLNFLPEDDFRIYHYLRIPDENGHFQMDFLLLSLYFFLIIEVKNIYDHVNFDEMGQAYRESADKVEVFGNPVDQVYLQQRRLLSWLRAGNFPAVPIEKVVVFSQDSTYLRNLTNNSTISETVMHRHKFLPMIDLFSKKYTMKCFSNDQLIELSQCLLEAHTPEVYGGVEKFGITMEDLVKGVACPACSGVPMQWKSGKWVCMGCQFKSKTAHWQALTDYRLLIGESINNREARAFLKLNSNSVTRKLLHSQGLKKFGTGSGLRYRLGEE